MKTRFSKQIWNNVEKHDLKKFSNDLFRRDIQESLSSKDTFYNDQIHTIMCNIFIRQAPSKEDIFGLIRHLPWTIF